MRIKVVLVGHPNVGKSVVFNNLTGLNAIVSNYPGTTVEIYKGKTRWKGFIIELIDTPGTYSLVPTTQAEEVTCRVILEERPDVIVHVIDATSIRRHLYLTLELLEVGVPVVLVVNQIDRAEALGIKIQKEELGRLLNIPVVMCVATKKIGMIALLDKIVEAYKRRSIAYPRYSKRIEKYLGLIEKTLKEELSPDLKHFSRFIAIHVILGNKVLNSLARTIPEHLKVEAPKYSRKIILEQARIADEIYREAVSIREMKHLKLSKIDYISVSPIFGLTIVTALTLAVSYSLLGLIHEIGHRIPSMLYYNLYEPFIRSLIESIVPQGLLHDILVGEKAGIYGSLGLLTTGVFFVFFMILPTIFVLYLVLGMLEDLGFLPRVAISFHRPLRKIGLSGDATMPLVIGTGCSIVGVLSTRILRSDKERFIASFLQVLGIPCMAQQVMIWYILGKHGVLYIFVLYLLLL
ncbi:MAG TPA: ferrous iron transporter B, partial [Thermofilum sp.]|nr:ferrous iron transporter B [Thermofilum sp.]